ncbi:bifunctional oligoribonuclease/PAP phosphatase NrnA [Ornithinibacillus gellani]|uniref:DHH family phosphoesterase n=1 Tax=Ornithinibacillus gellani TaxID=2293253 RepID=UPI000F4AE94B|nr:bifunctional oligoribonuclease/PAP phosphatase NrnA [Ornithinibacillus gellani]TQS76256.1 bifunctional oligoribonuclease/PAP phosphatase NrnA [Ornithinibacillus gellani]
MIQEQIIEEIRKHQTIIIHRHVRPDPDALGSQAGLKELIVQAFPDKNVFCVGTEDPSLSFLTQMDHIDNQVYQDALVIVCDTANTDRIDDTRYTLGAKIIKIDHHPNVDVYGDIQWVDTNASSTSEMIYDLYLYGKDTYFQMNETIARLIYAGIVGDTGRFLFPSTTKKTFEYAAGLVEYHFDRSEIYDGIYNVKPEIARLKGYILQNFKLSPAGVSSIKLTKAKLDELGINPLETGHIVGVFGDIEGVKAWAVFVEEENLIRVRLRSKGPVINTIAAKYNGGGHPLAAGASIYDWKDYEAIMQELENACIQEK